MVEVIRDRIFYTPPGAKPLLADLYLPQKAGARAPVIIWLHGGGWKLGDRRLGPDLSRFFAQTGFAMVAIEYRLSGEAKFPAQVIDVKTAVRWVRSVADEFNFDAQQVGLWGSSSGGHLAAIAALSEAGHFRSEAYSEFDSSVQAVVDGYGPTDFSQMDAMRQPVVKKADSDKESQAVMKEIRTGAAESFESQLIGAPVESSPELVRAANPVTYVRPGAPQFLILHGEADFLVPSHQSQLLFDALRGAGNRATLALIEKLGHGFLNNSDLGTVDHGRITVQTTPTANEDGKAFESADSIFGGIEAFFRKHLRNPD